MIILTDIATEGSTFIATCTFTDEDGDAVTPATDVAWRVLDDKGVQIGAGGTETAAASVSIVLGASDLVIDDSNKELHWLTLVVSTTYNSALGNGLPLVDMAKFKCRNIFDTP